MKGTGKPVPSPCAQDLEYNNNFFDRWLSDNGYVINRSEKQIPTLATLIESFRQSVTFSFEDGGTIQSDMELGIDEDGNTWRYKGVIPEGGLVIAPGTVPSDPPWVRTGHVTSLQVLRPGGETQEDFNNSLLIQTNSIQDLIDGKKSNGVTIDHKLDQLWSVNVYGYGPIFYRITSELPNGHNIIDVGDGLSAKVINDKSLYLDLSKWGAEDGTDITTKLQAALTYLSESRGDGQVKGFVSIPTGWSVTLSDGIEVKAGCGFFFEGSTVTQTKSGVVTFGTDSPFSPVGIKIKGSALYGPDDTKEKRLGSGSFGIKVTGGLPFTQVDIDELKHFEWGGYAKDSYSSRIRFGRIWENRVNWQFQDQCHASEIDSEFSEFADDDTLRINDGESVSFVHNITFRGAYQKSRYGVIAIKCYEVWGENIYHEENTEADIQFGAGSGGNYDLAAYNCGVRTIQSASPTGLGNNQGNIVLRHAVGISFPNVSILGGATGNNINYDGFCDDIVYEVKIGNEPRVKQIGSGATYSKFSRFVYRGEERVYKPTKLEWTRNNALKGKRYAASISGREYLVDEINGDSQFDYLNTCGNRQIFADEQGAAGVYAINIDHINSRVNLGYPAYTNDGALITSDPREKHDINVCSLGADFCRELIESGGVIQYRLNEGTSGRLHYGLRTDKLKEVGLNYVESTKDLGMYAEFDQVDKDGKKTGENREAARYEEMIAPMLMYIRELERRIEKLEK